MRPTGKERDHEEQNSPLDLGYEHRRSGELPAGALPAAAQSSHSLRIENNTGYDIQILRVSSVSDPNWGRDILGASVLAYGSSSR